MYSHSLEELAQRLVILVTPVCEARSILRVWRPLVKLCRWFLWPRPWSTLIRWASTGSGPTPLLL